MPRVQYGKGQKTDRRSTLCHLRSGAVHVGASAPAVVYLFLLVMLGQVAMTQPDTRLNETADALKVQHVATFTGPGNLRWTLPPDVELALRIIAGPPDSPPKDGKMQVPTAVVTDSQNRLLVADAGPMAVHVFDFAHRKYFDIDARQSGMRSMAAIAVDDRNRIYISDSLLGKIFIFTGKGKFLGYFQNRKGQESYYMSPVGIAIDHAHGYIYVCDRDRNMVIKADESGHVLQHFGTRGGGNGPGDFRKPTQIAIARGEIFVLDSGNDRIQQLNSKGEFLREVRIPEGAGLAVDKEKRILLSEPTIHRITVYRNDGNLMTKFGDEGVPQGESFDPSSLWLQSDHCLYVADKNNKRVELFQVGSYSGKSCPR